MAITYNYSTDWINRDSQPDASPLRIIKASDFLNEWTAIQTAFSQAVGSASPTLTGTTTVTDLVVNGSFTLSGYNNSNWDTAFGWGDHSVAGYATADGANATGTWPVSVTGNAATAGTATNCSRSVVAGTNLSGGGALTGDVTINLAAEPSVTSVILGNFKIVDSGTDLLVQYNGASVFKITSTGAMVAEGEVTAFGTA